ncbi:hypothetical protein F4861DRAFT_162473 [Xylaria intraflava]|nr:hypothetical protein F4861DRAFT_162473 [Xylaria intraflava]
MENTDVADTMTIHAIVTGAPTDPAVASAFTPSIKVIENQPGRPGNSSAVAMSILYSITGLITLLFLFIIATGAIRAHRNPERYGPRASANGRPRRSRARGLAMAMLETLPIVKFGESDQRKPDEETALDSVSGVVSQPHDAPHGETENAPNDAVVSAPSTETANNADSHQTPPDKTQTPTSTPTSAPAPAPAAAAATAPIPAISTPQEGGDDSQSKDDHLGCSICTEDFTVGEDVRVLPCDHKFHPACVDPWLVNVSGTCPLCRLDLRPPEEPEREESGEAAPSQEAATTTADGHLAPPTTAQQASEPNAANETTHRRRRSRLFDWNRLRHAPVDERVQALRLYRQFLQGSDPASADERRHSRLTDRLRERLHIRSDTRSDARSSTASPENPPPEPPPPASTTQH